MNFHDPIDVVVFSLLVILIVAGAIPPSIIVAGVLIGIIVDRVVTR
jgi:hypothetical protein